MLSLDNLFAFDQFCAFHFISSYLNFNLLIVEDSLVAYSLPSDASLVPLLIIHIQVYKSAIFTVMAILE